ncbi:MAG: ABC transporter permease [Pedobacter sp.]
MKRIFSLAIITFKEGIRNRALFGIALLALFLFGLNIAVAGFFMRDIGKVTVDMNLSALSLTGLLLIFFIGINLMAKDIDRKTIHLVLSKPITRGQYIWGKFFGIQLFALVSMMMLVLFSCATVFLLFRIYPGYFIGFHWSIFLIACFFVFIKISVLTGIVVFFSSITSSSFITLIFSISSYVVGVTIEEVVFYLNSAFAAKEILVPGALKYFIAVVSYLLPNLSAFDFSLEAAHGLAVETSRFVLSLGYAGTYVTLLLLLGSVIFARREFN